MYYEIEEYEEPREILDRMSEPYAEMSKHDHGFLCGLLKKNRPNKVVEIGVCAGGTTGVMHICFLLIYLKSVIEGLVRKRDFYLMRLKRN